jgi:hypothetical protein
MILNTKTRKHLKKEFIMNWKQNWETIREYHEITF